jgi:hypothetical protein
LTKSACISVGVAHYSDTRLQPLPGAAKDAQRFFDAATNPRTGICDPAHSTLLIDPTTQEVREQIARIAYSTDIKNVTLFFAGHGGESKSGYYLACNNSDSARLAFTGLSLTDIFQIINENGRLHANIVIDACQAGALALDVPALTKSFETGVAGGVSVSLLALSSRYESANESLDGSGGYGTNALLRVMSGGADTGSNKAELTLADVAQQIGSIEGGQTPSFWSFNLQGMPEFCRNTFALQNRPMSVFRNPNTHEGSTPDINARTKDDLWLYYLECERVADTRKLYKLLNSLSQDIGSAAASKVLLGLFDSFVARSRGSDDLFAPIEIASVFAVFAHDVLRSREVSLYFLRNVSKELIDALSLLADDLERDDLLLVRGGGGYCEFYNLPQRLTLLSAWSLSAMRLAPFGNHDPERVLEVVNRILRTLRKSYSGSFELVSESQAAGIVCISALSKEFGVSYFSEDFIGGLYNSYCECGGKIAREGLPDGDIFGFLRHRLSDEPADFEKYCDRPSESLFTMVAHFWINDALDVIRYDLIDFDGVVVGTFVPSSYLHFSDEIIRSGSSIYFRFGFELFTVAECADFFGDHLRSRVMTACQDLDELGSCMALVSSLLFPDRVPWHLLVK